MQDVCDIYIIRAQHGCNRHLAHKLIQKFFNCHEEFYLVTNLKHLCVYICMCRGGVHTCICICIYIKGGISHRSTYNLQSLPEVWALGVHARELRGNKRGASWTEAKVDTSRLWLRASADILSHRLASHTW